MKASDYEATFTTDPLRGFLDAAVSDVPLGEVMPQAFHPAEGVVVESIPNWAVGPVGESDPRVWVARCVQGNGRTVRTLTHHEDILVDIYTTTDLDVVREQDPRRAFRLGAAPLSETEHGRMMTALLLVRIDWLDSISAVARRTAARRDRAARADDN